MESNIEKYQKDLKSLIERGQRLFCGLCNEFSDEIGNINKETKDFLNKFSFKEQYHSWYNESLAVLKQLMPARYDDFVNLYKQPNRKKYTYETYTISDYLIGLVSKNAYDEYSFEPSSIINKFEQQVQIIESLNSRFSSSLFDIKQLVQADVFDSELDSAKELNKKGFLRAAGAICGVVIEKHLCQVCTSRGIAVSKKNLAINDYNEILKNEGVIDVPTWRFIQRLGDIRNICDHNKAEEPTKENIKDLIDGTDKIIKTVF